MVDWILHTGLYLLGMALIPAVGVVPAWWGLWGDRSKGRARCPERWYDVRWPVPRGWLGGPRSWWSVRLRLRDAAVEPSPRALVGYNVAVGAGRLLSSDRARCVG